MRPFPNVDDGQWLVSAGGSVKPLWSPDGRELFYRRGAALMAVPVETDATFAHEAPEVLFEGDYHDAANGRTYDISPDGQRFLMIKEDPGTGENARQMIVVQHWFEELRRLVPTT